MDTPVLDMLYTYARLEGERWHMPGHKGLRPPGGDFLDWAYDVTEIGPMDETPNPVQLSERLMAESYGAERTWYSVAGATLPVMAAILAANPPGSTLWVDRTCHRSVLGALTIGGYHVRWLYPAFVRAGIMLPLEEFPEDFQGASGLVLTRPTYDGLARDNAEVIERAHHQGLTVIVDEAHGSHWQGRHYPISALRQGADLIAHGVHKTEGSLTQTGLLHLQGKRVSPAEVERWWKILGTSSPSYLLLGALDRLQWERRQPEYARRWERLGERAEELWNTLEQRGHHVLQPWAKRQGLSVDPARLTLLGPGKMIQERIGSWGEMEKVTPGSGTFFLSPDQDPAALLEALDGISFPTAAQELDRVSFPRLRTAMTVRETWSRKARRLPLAEARGHVVKEALTPYPPGIPVAVPGEVLTDEMIAWLQWWSATATGPIQGLTMEEGRQWVWVTEA